MGPTRGATARRGNDDNEEKMGPPARKYYREAAQHGCKAAKRTLVVERDNVKKCYLAQTILTMGMAYKDARLICRPNSDWLKDW